MYSDETEKIWPKYESWEDTFPETQSENVTTDKDLTMVTNEKTGGIAFAKRAVNEKLDYNIYFFEIKESEKFELTIGVAKVDKTKVEKSEEEAARGEDDSSSEEASSVVSSDKESSSESYEGGSSDEDSSVASDSDNEEDDEDDEDAEYTFKVKKTWGIRLNDFFKI